MYLSLSTEQLLQAPSVMMPAGALPALTTREKEVLQLIGEGFTNPQIVEKLFISPLTVDSHRKNLLIITFWIKIAGQSFDGRPVRLACSGQNANGKNRFGFYL